MKIDTIKVKVLLAQRNISVKQFCLENNLSYSTVMALLNNKRYGNSKTIERIANALGVNVIDILKM